MLKLDAKTWGVIAVVAVLVIFGYFYSTSNPAPQTGAPAAPSAAVPSPVSAPAAAPQAKTAAPAIRPSYISITSPMKGEKWVLGQIHTIRWSAAAQSVGQIYLVSMPSGTVVGWINPSTGVNQTYYEWSTKDVSVALGGSARKDIGVGDYVIKIKFDNKTLSEMTSGTFSVVYQSEISPAALKVQIKNFTATPAFVSVKQGDQVSITNNDSVPYAISVVGRSGFTVQPGQTAIFDTASLGQGQYYLYSDQYQSLKLTVNVL